jgi:membrane protein
MGTVAGISRKVDGASDVRPYWVGLTTRRGPSYNAKSKKERDRIYLFGGEKMKIKDLWKLLKRTVQEWSEDKASRLAAALSYYTIFSLAPLLVIVISIAGLVFGEETAQQELVGQIEGLVGEQGASAIQEMIAGASQTEDSIFAAVVGFVILLFGAAGVFAQLQDALNTMWEVQPEEGRGILGFIKKRFVSFGMVLGIGFLLLVSLVISAALAVLGNFLVGLLPAYEIIMQVVSFVISFAVVTLLFALLFKFLPDAKVAWGDVWLGAVVTALLFTIGKELIGIYLGRSAVASTYGAAGSLVVLLLWIYYSGQILFFGAEFTQVYANMFGSRIVPAEGATHISEEARIKQGIPHAERAGAGQKKEQAYLQVGLPGPNPSNPLYRPKPGRQIQKLDRSRSPAQKSITTISLILLGLVSFVGSLMIKKYRD